MKTTTINSKWRVDHDGEVSTLVFFEPRVKKLLGKDKKPTGETEDYIYEQSYYYPNLATALGGYLLRSLDDSKDLKDILRVITETKKEIYGKINTNTTSKN